VSDVLGGRTFGDFGEIHVVCPASGPKIRREREPTGMGLFVVSGNIIVNLINSSSIAAWLSPHPPAGEEQHFFIKNL